MGGVVNIWDSFIGIKSQELEGFDEVIQVREDFEMVVSVVLLFLCFMVMI